MFCIAFYNCDCTTVLRIYRHFTYTHDDNRDIFPHSNTKFHNFKNHKMTKPY